MSLRHAALGLLSQEPGSGYDLLKRFKESMDNMWPATQSQLYGELNKLATAGLIEVSDVGPRGRKEYAITDAGRAELRRWMTSPQEDPPIRNAAILRVFLLGQLEPAQAREYLKSLLAVAEEEHARYAEMLDSYDWSVDDDAFFARAALEQGLRWTQHEIEWATWVLDGLSERRRNASPSVQIATPSSTTSLSRN
ncbi:PadR family transcriptional regulator [Mycobacterium asiaticum]|uniref:PadR family transcriptional regulator n=1 Tax=Mycobacterium asiaticum TaxID=1790 RepID=A0A1A3NBK9_MYCAS|nr:PadR family transcriptional regulator [Mycobacterium asiaticum]OBK19523.1 PadR family transcriptional regulator [Mycobacterium asiaticum]